MRVGRLLVLALRALRAPRPALAPVTPGPRYGAVIADERREDDVVDALVDFHSFIWRVHVQGRLMVG